METDYWIYIIFWSFIWGLIAMAISQKKGESGVGFLIGFLLGPIGVLLALASKGNRVKCPFCSESVDPKASVCPHCQRDVQRFGKTTSIPAEGSAEELLQFKQLLDSGVITQDEFDTAKARILGTIPPQTVQPGGFVQME